MSSFDDLLGQYEPPGEVEIFLPGKVGENGGTGANNNGPASSGGGKPSDSQSSGTGPEPSPQLPEGSDPDEPDAPEEEDETAEEATGNTPPVDEPYEDPDDADADSGAQPAGTASPGEPAPLVIPRKGGGLSFEGESAYLKQFPRILIDQMREILSPRLGATFARDISQVSIVTAFVMAGMGAEIATDEITAHAVRAFREADPRTDAIDKRTVLLLEQQAKSEATLKKVLAKLGDVVDTAGVLEMGQAYALAERTAQLDTAGALPESLDVTQKRVVATRDNVRRRVASLQKDEKTRAGRPIR